MTRRVELLYLPDCPNVEAARDQLRLAFEVVGLTPYWTEVDISVPSVIPQMRAYGSPTILINGRDVVSVDWVDGAACRVYSGSEQRGAPPLDAIVFALQSSQPTLLFSKSSLSVVPGLLVSLVPVVSCPACWPAYASLLGAIGIPFLMKIEWLLPITIVALLMAPIGLTVGASQRRGYGPAIAGAVAAGLIVLGKFVLLSSLATYTGLALLIIVSIWNHWPVTIPSNGAVGSPGLGPDSQGQCASCVNTEK